MRVGACAGTHGVREGLRRRRAWQRAVYDRTVGHAASGDTSPEAHLRPSILVVGRNRVGKSTAARFLSQHLSLTAVELGARVRLAQASDRSLARETGVAFCELLARKGKGLVRDWVSEAGVSSMNPGIVVGVRDRDSFDDLRKYLSGPLVLAVLASFTRRLGRPQRVGESEASLRLSDLRQGLWGLDSIISEASFVVDNSRELRDFHGQLRDLLPDLGRRRS